MAYTPNPKKAKNWKMAISDAKVHIVKAFEAGCFRAATIQEAANLMFPYMNLDKEDQLEFVRELKYMIRDLKKDVKAAMEDIGYPMTLEEVLEMELSSTFGVMGDYTWYVYVKEE